MARVADADDAREQADTYDARADALEAEAERVRAADSLAGTPWSALFHEARTSRTEQNGGHRTVEVQYRATPEGVETHDTPVKTRGGEHLRGTDAWDGSIKLQIEPFKPLDRAAARIAEQLGREARHLRQNAGEYRMTAERLEAPR